ncbi:ketoacyl-synt-domain-containing protein [Aspergillus sclerotioniger CBS 115572]|uniref:Ketoacyl-synt-domain-containing protein n=1 Tax=Aspergillus sclerotioniger CBS 115572 TaxID=1450535 RepID=A0A317XA79_9EURO|nr:ketoacyl-synt-domain-containing protein [Aspergillus sclerotioniger CBS 115572]PWY93430.1 ketoacyl-synt-domain-containing protein [Aspergillus sclerotioniger CBS 115572]
MTRAEPIAIIGTGCRFPGSASTPSRLWELLQNPHNVASKPPSDRFNIDAFYQAGKARPGMTNAPESYFLQEDVRTFDAPLFKISPAEAASMDPQQRLLMEVVYESLERAGLQLQRLTGSQTGVYCGFMNYDYGQLLNADTSALHPFLLSGTAPAVLANRLSYFFDWRGPSFVLDTACSASLTALHLAAEALQNGDCSLAVAAGSSLILSPDPYIGESQMQMLSPTGRSRMWDQAADGYARGEGVAALVLKRLSDAVADGDPIECVIRSTGINCDGRTKALTMPNGEAQLELIRSTYARAGLDPLRPEDRCQYFEAHGTGTPAGDPQEASGIAGAFFNEESQADDIMYAGSIKTVVGHTEATAGLAGVIKGSLAIQHGVIPPNLLFNQLSPLVAPHASHLRIPTQPIPWPKLPPGTPRRVSVNSFGFGGANAHVILESFTRPEQIQPHREPTIPAILPFVFSAASEASLTAVLKQYVDYLDERPTLDLLELAASLISKRSSLTHRLILTADSVESLREALNGEIQKRPGDTSSTITRRVGAEPKRIFGVFTGQGAQWPQMGLDVVSQCPQAAGWLKELQQSLDTLPTEYRPTFTLFNELSAPEATSRLNTAAVSLPLRTALQIIQVKILRSLGIDFAAVVGHSSGEIAAAYAAGRLTAGEAIRVAYLRGVAAQHAGSPGQSGAMLAVGISWEQAQAICSEAPYSGRVCVAAVNSPSSVTFSGDSELISELEWLFESLDQSPRRLRVDTAYHSHHMIPCADPYIQAMKTCQIEGLQGSSTTKWYSSVFENQVIESLDIQYWSDNMLRPVNFSQALTAAMKDIPELDMIIEVGPHAALQGPTLQTLSSIKPDDADVPYIGLANRKSGGIEALSRAVGSFWAYLGAEMLDILPYLQLFSPSIEPKYLPDLPTYPFDHSQKYWGVPRLSTARINRRLPIHPLLGAITPETGEAEWRWRNYLRAQDLEWVDGHQVQSHVVFPATGYLVMALEAARIIANERPLHLVEIHELTIDRAISVPDDAPGMETLFTFYRTSGNDDTMTGTFTCQASFDGTFTCCASGRMEVAFGELDATLLPPRGPPTPGMRSVDSDHFYGELEKLGYGYNKLFRSLQDIKRLKDVASGIIPAHDREDDSRLLLHPATLDTGLQALIATIGHPGDGQLSGLYLPTKIARTTINPAFCRATENVFHGPFGVEATLSGIDNAGMRGDVDLFTPQGDGVVQIEGVHIAPLSRPTIDSFAEEVWGPLLPNATLSSSVGTPDFHSLRLQGDRLALLYLRDTQKQLTTEDRQQLDWHRGRYVEWMDWVLARISAGDHPLYPAQWLEGDVESVITPEDTKANEIIVTGLHVTGGNLLGWLRGQTSIMEELRRDDLLGRIYREGHEVHTMTRNLAGLVGQLAFRFPRAKVLEVGAGTGSATRMVLNRIGRDYHSYTYTDISAAFFEDAQDTFVKHEDRFSYEVLDIEQDPTEQGFQEHAYDLVIASNVLHATSSLKKTMTHVRRLLKPGGRVAILELTDTESLTFSFIFGAFEGWWLGEPDGRKWGPLLSTDGWDEVLRNSGFGGLETASPPEESKLLGLSAFTAQAVDDHIQRLQHPLSVPANSQYPDLILLGGATAATECLVSAVRELIAPFFGRITHVATLEAFDAPSDASLPIVLTLTDMDKPCLKGLTPDRLRSLQALVGTASKLLWVATGRPGQDPYVGMTKGLLRCQSYENSHALFQHLSIEDPDAVSSPEVVIATALMRLAHIEVGNDYTLANSTESPEWELRVDDDGTLKIPRMRSSNAMNHRLLTSRGFSSSDSVEPRHARVQILPDGSNFSLASYPLKDPSNEMAHEPCVRVQVHYATLFGVCIDGTFLHVILGQNEKTKARVVALSVDHASVVSTPVSWCLGAPTWLAEEDEATFLNEISTAMVARQLVSKTPVNSTLLVHEASGALQESLAAIASLKGVRVRFTTRIKNPYQSPAMVTIPPRSSSRAISRLLPAGVSVFATFGSEPDTRIQSSLPSTVATYGVQNFYGAPLAPANGFILGKDALVSSCLLAEQRIGSRPAVVTVKPEDIGGYSPSSYRSEIVDWVHSGQVSAYTPSASSLVELSAHKTYLLVGMTGDLGRSVCHWMITRGARSLVLTSRSPNIDPGWLEEMSALGARVAVMAMDVSDRTSVLKVHDRILAELPSVGGVVNGAMVLRDSLFADMALEDVLHVLKPKVEGSLILDELYQDNDLDFFILMGSFAGVFGNFNQTAYAAAAEFMSGLVHQRRLRGQVGSIIHPGEIRGIGYVARMDSHLMDVLAQNVGNLSISERDLLELFAEAVVAGRPDSNRTPAIIGGLAMTDPAVYPDVLWYSNPVLWPYIEYFQQSEVLEANQDQVPIKVQLQSAGTLGQVVDIIATGFRIKLRKKLHLPVDGELPGTSLLTELGVDSLVAVDLRVWFVKELGVDMPVLQLLGGSSIDALARSAAERLDPALLSLEQA